MLVLKKIFVSFLALIIFCSSLSLFAFSDSVNSNLKSEKSESLIDSSLKFSDVVSTAWYKSYVDYVATFGLMNGMTPNTFEPNYNLNRAMFVQILANMENVDTGNTNVETVFNDVPSGKWYTSAVKWAYENGIVNGMTDVTFEPLAEVQRQQMCTMLVRYTQYKGIELKNIVSKKEFADSSRIQDYAKEAVAVCQTAGIVDGMDEVNFAPRDSATRAQIAAVLYRFCKRDEIVDVPDDNLPDEDQTDINGPEFSKYNFDENPLINADGKANKSFLPSFDLDSTEFVKSKSGGTTKLSDLKGKTLTFFTGDNYGVWSYQKPNGVYVDEWAWFSELKESLGLNIKYTVRQHKTAIDSALTAMSSGKSCDIIYTNHVAYPASLGISQSLEKYVNMDRLDKSPGICSRAMDLVKWGSKSYIISPLGNVDVLWYNQTLSRELNLEDPHQTWERGQWNWGTFSNYLLSAPRVNDKAQKLTAFVQWPKNAAYNWPSTNGIQYIDIVTDSSKPSILNNWSNPKTYEAWQFITDLSKSINYSTKSADHIGLYSGTTLMSSTMYTQIYRNIEYAKHIQINWVPYPRSSNSYGEEVCQLKGHAMMLPKKTSNPDNIYPALKFMELWASRFTESIFDNLNTFEYYNFNYMQRKQYFDFATNNMVFALPMNDYIDTDIRNQTSFFECFEEDSIYNLKTEADKAAKMLNTYIIDCLQYGQIISVFNY